MPVIPTNTDEGPKKKLVRVRAKSQAKPAAAVLDSLCKKYGVDAPMPVQMGEAAEGSMAVIFENMTKPERQNIETAMIGNVGTRLNVGRLRDPSGDYQPTSVRGTAGNFGLYDTYRITESMIYDATQSITELVTSAAPKFVMPSKVLRSQESSVRDFVNQQNAALESFKCVDGGWTRFAEEVMTQVWAGFQITEPRFKKGRNKKGWVWCGGEPRIQSTVDRWHTYDDTLLGVQFKSNNSTPGNPSGYFLPAIGTRPIDRHVLLFRVGGYGLDYEGDPPTRPSVHWVKFKRLISQIVPAAIEKYGSPYTFLKTDPAYLAALAAGAPVDIPDLEEAYNAFLELQAVDVPVGYFGEGVIADTTSPPGTMPDLRDWISYCDSMIAFPFSNEGNLMGLQSAVGSYAQAEVRERRFLRSAPYYQRKLTDPINEQIIKPLVNWQIGEMPEYPRLVLSSSRMSDNSAWITDARNLFGPNLPVDQWPEGFRNTAYEKMGIHDQTLEVIEDETE